MAQKLPTLREFQKRFPTEDSCLDHLFQVRYGEDFNCPGCERPAKYNRVKGRRSYQCNWCRYQLYPTAGTPFDRTRTSLQDWFYVMFLFTTTRNGVAAKRVEREIGVTYKTAWRMCDQIRKYMTLIDTDDMIGGPGTVVEVDETHIGGHATGGRGRYAGGKPVVLGMLEKGGELVTRVVPNVKMHNLIPVVHETVKRGSHIHTDALPSYQHLGKHGYRHSKVRHQWKEYVGPEGQTVNTIEGFWAILKRGINGTYIHVSAKHLPKYLGEFEYRWNMRDCPHLMLDRLMYSFTR